MFNNIFVLGLLLVKQAKPNFREHGLCSIEIWFFLFIGVQHL